ncbi:hypothetical protein [Caballeronia sp. LZ001]|uniref:hypothetical protein n=1 Tax=Caballeronia sp. LZ001 TaxID=3038553 RepID=UPI002855C9B2|nr:hypothetical protein [Caballeronia sp. LZ001]MDR5802178.1 hypothetical protein [Caballeronia sp. LZ001]
MTYQEWMNQHLLTTGHMPTHWSTWQAAERQAFARAIAACDQIDLVGADECIDAIRALNESKEG